MNDSPLAVVTGGSSGIGRSVCLRLAKEGYSVINADIKAPEEKNSDNYCHVFCDVTRGDHIRQLSEMVHQKGMLRLLVLNAGRGIHERIREGDPDKWAEIINVNLCGTLRVIRALLPFMKQGHLIFISSVSSSRPHPYGGIYAATKSAMDTIAETIRQEELPDIGVTVIAPGIVDTRFFENMISGHHSVESIGWGSIEPDEIADAVAYVVAQKKGTFVNNITIRPSRQIL